MLCERGNQSTDSRLTNLIAQHADALVLSAPCDISASTCISLGIDVVVNDDKDADLQVFAVLPYSESFRLIPDADCAG